MKAKPSKANPAYFDRTEEGFDSEQELYELMQERAELELHLDMHHKTPARFDNDAWSY